TKTLTQKVLEGHLVAGTYDPGSEIGIRIDQTLTQDATGTMAFLQFEAMGVDRVKTDRSVSFIDHNTIQIGFENADDHRYLQSVAARYGLYLSRAGNGICHQVHLERFGRPAATLLGSDSHTPTGGGIGQIAIGAGGLDVALAMAGEPFYLTCPSVIRINLTGRLQPWVSAKDVILKILEIFGTKGNVGCVFEYGGPGALTLSVPERATITNMGAECGVTTSLFPSDDETRKFLKAQRREEDWQRLAADPDAAYSRVVDIDLSQLIPLAATPHSPGNIATVKELEGMEVHQVCVGSCTNSSYRDLMVVAKTLKGTKVHPGVSFILAPGSRQVVDMLARNGALADLIETGVRLEENACGFCIGNSQSPQTDAVSLRTSNRNFLGRSGTKSANVYLVSPETAAAAVITGRITDPRDLGIPYPEIAIPDAFIVDDSMMIPPADDPGGVEICRGPNIGAPPTNDPLPERVAGVVTIKVGDNITTDHIIPAGARMKYRSNIPAYSAFLFEVLDPGFYNRAREVRESGRDNIIVGGVSYGQGSSREHAALCPMYMGVKAGIARSFERIHTANLINFGIVPLTFKSEADYAAIQEGDSLEIPDIRKKIGAGKPLIVRNTTQGTEFEIACDLSERAKEIVLAGGMLSLIRDKKSMGEG
ncbi:MAG: aconitate hydratase, partial [Deltaproteobacteria bacterium]|nr:aconitate hydratase [Deltaproteobacteria bacterium]